ncbi:hypothetical protein Tco_0062746, partial [Tanacetum coccineum]
MLWGHLDDMLIKKQTRHVGLYPIVLTAMSVKLYNSKTHNLLNLSAIHDNHCDVELTKEMLPPDSIEAKARTLENLPMWAHNRKYDIRLTRSEQRRVGTTHHAVVKNVRKETSTARMVNF